MSTYPAGTTIPIPFELYDAAGDPVTGATALIRIMRGADQKFWNGSTWQDAEVNFDMTEHANLAGHYYYLFDHSAAQDSTKDTEYYTIRTSIESGGTKGGVTNLIATSTAMAAAILARKMLTNRTELAAGTSGNFKVYDDDDTLLLTFDVSDASDATIVESSGVPFKRSKGT